MGQTINTNLMSLNAQRNLSMSQSSLSTSMQRLSSGIRVNSAKDDAAGLAIAERMNTQIRGLNVAARNANDGISLSQIAEGALGKIGEVLQRIRELAVQAANDTNSANDRGALQAEVDQLTAEIGRIAGDTNFNGTKLLDGTFSSQYFQLGANEGEEIELSNLLNAKPDALGSEIEGGYFQSFAATPFEIDDPNAATSLSINGVTIQISEGDGNRTKAEALADLADAFTTAKAANPTELDGIILTAGGYLSANTPTNKDLTLASFSNFTSAPTEGTTSGTYSPPGSFETYTATLASGINDPNNDAKITINGVEIVIEEPLSNNPTKLDANGNTITDNDYWPTKFQQALSDLQANPTYASALEGVEFNASTRTVTYSGSTDTRSPIKFSNSDNFDNALDESSTPAFNEYDSSIQSLTIETRDGAKMAIATMDRALSSINEARATLGALQSRFETAISNITVTSENLSAARSRIMDADFAIETANLSRAQILQQAGMAMVAQANALPQQVLQLLQR
jgi:flagellin